MCIFRFYFLISIVLHLYFSYHRRKKVLHFQGEDDRILFVVVCLETLCS